MLKEDSNKVYKLLEKAYEQYNGNVSELLRNLLSSYGCNGDIGWLKYQLSSGEYFNEEHSKRIMPKQFWNILFENIGQFNRKEYFELLIPIFESCICPEELFYAIYNIVPKISDYLDNNAGIEHNGTWWDKNTKYVRLLAHAERNDAVRVMLLTMLMNPNCPIAIKNEIALSPEKAKYYMVSDVAKANSLVSTPLVEQPLKHNIPFTSDSKDWWNPARSEKIVGDLFFPELELISKLNTDEKAIASQISEDASEELLRHLADSNKTYIRGMIAKLKKCPIDILVQLSTDEDFYVRCQCFSNVSTPEEAFKKNIQKNFSTNDCVMMLCHPNCPSEVVSKILSGDFSYVGYLSHECPNLPKETIEDRLQRYDCHDFMDLFCRKNCTYDLVNQLLHHSQVRESADLLASLTVFYDLYHSKHVEPQYKSSYDPEQESRAFDNNCRAAIAFNSKMSTAPSYYIIDPAPAQFVDPANHAKMTYDPSILIGNDPKSLVKEQRKYRGY